MGGNIESSHLRKVTQNNRSPTSAQQMKGALQRTFQRVLSKRHDPQIGRQVNSVSPSGYNVLTQAPLTTFPLAETGWEHPVETPPNSSSDDSFSEYNCSVEDTLSRLLEIHQVGKSDVSFQNLHSAVTAGRHSKSLHSCYLCGRTKFLNELCGHCTLTPAAAQR